MRCLRTSGKFERANSATKQGLAGDWSFPNWSFVSRVLPQGEELALTLADARVLAFDMDPKKQKEEFSRAYVRAVAAAVGMSTYELSVDDDSIDLGLAARGGQGRLRSPRIEVQLKCTAEQPPPGPDFPYDLRIKNYEELRGAAVVPRLLVVVVVPEFPGDWISHSEDQLVLRKCGYWVSLREMPNVQNTRSVTVRVPRVQVFNVTALIHLMTMVGEGGAP